MCFANVCFNNKFNRDKNCAMPSATAIAAKKEKRKKEKKEEKRKKGKKEKRKC